LTKKQGDNRRYSLRHVWQERRKPNVRIRVASETGQSTSELRGFAGESSPIELTRSGEDPGPEERGEAYRQGR